MSVLRLTDLAVWLPGARDPVLQGIDLTIDPGEVVALVGASGAGKTTLGQAISGLLPAGTRQSGLIELANRRPAVAPVFQVARAGLSELRRIGDQISDALRLAGRPVGDVVSLLGELGLDPAVAQLRAGSLSGGMTQRVAFARALATGAPLIVADEPTAALDGLATRQVLAMLGRARAAGRGVLLITHDAEQVAGLADRIAVLERGRLLECGRAGALLTSPEQPATQALLAALPARAKELADLPGAIPVLPPRPVPAPDLLRLEDLGYWHPGAAGLALQGISLSVSSGEILGLVGASGSGKTTLARLIARLLPLSLGRLWFRGEEIGTIRPERFARDPRRANIQMVFQEAGASFIPGWTIADCIAAAQSRLGRSVAQITEVCGPAGFDPALLSRRPDQLSQGQLARAALVRAMAADPDLLLLDEPVAALDPVTQAGIMKTLAGLRASGLAMILVTHDLHVARLLTDRMAVLDRGRVVETGVTGRLLAAPAHPLTRALVAAMPATPALASPGASG